MSIGFFFFFVRHYKANSPSVEVYGDKEALSFLLTSLALDSQEFQKKKRFSPFSDSNQHIQAPI